MTEGGFNRVSAICYGIVVLGAVAGFIAAIVLFRVLCTKGNNEAPGAGMFLILAWAVLIPTGALVAGVPAWFIFRRQCYFRKRR